MKGVLMAIGLILIVGIFVIAYSYSPEPVVNEVNVCLHLSDYGCSTISYLTELGVKWVRTDWLITSDGSLRYYSQNLENTCPHFS